MQASLQRDSLRTQVRNCGWVTAKNEEPSPSASGSQACKCRAPRVREANRAAVARAGKLMRAEMMSFAVVSEVFRP